MTLREAGYETVMVNCNPETVSTDYDTSDRLYFEPLTLEDVLEVVHAERAAGPVAGVIVQLGGQTPLGLAQGLKDAGVPDRGHPARRRSTSPRSAARSAGCSPRPGCRRRSTAWPPSYERGARRSPPTSATRCWCGPSYVLGGRGMEIVYDDGACCAGYIERATADQPGAPGARRPVPRRRGRDRRRRAVRRRRALPRRRHGAHRGGRHPLRRLGLRAAADHARPRPRSSGSGAPPRRSRAASACAACSTSSTPWSATCSTCWRPTRARRRTVPFVSKATAVPLAKAAARVMIGATIAELRAEGVLPGDRRRRHAAAGRADRGQGGGAAVRPVPRRRHRARAGDALDRRGHGHRRAVRHRVRQVPAGGVRRRPADQGARVRVGRRPRQALDGLPGQAAGRPRASRSSPPRAPPRCCAATASTRPSCASTTRPRRRHPDAVAARSWPARST